MEFIQEGKIAGVTAITEGLREMQNGSETELDVRGEVPQNANERKLSILYCSTRSIMLRFPKILFTMSLIMVRDAFVRVGCFLFFHS